MPLDRQRRVGGHQVAETDQESAGSQDREYSANAPCALLIAIGDHGARLAGGVARHDLLHCSAFERLGEAGACRPARRARLVQVAEEVEDEDDRQRDADQPEDKSAAHDEVS